MPSINPNLSGKLLLATPSIGDERFHRAVIFIVTHDEKGALGLVINCPAEHVSLDDILTQVTSDDSNRPLKQVAIYKGGPVAPNAGFLLHTSDYKRAETISVSDKFAVTATIEALQDLVHHNGPRESLFILGYSGWESGQLEQELAQNAWVVVDADHELLFNTPAADCWNRAYGRLGIDPNQLSHSAGHA